VSDEHLPLDELAELDEGLLDPERANAARAHLDTCAQCRAGAEAIASTRATLAAMPDEPMPEDVKARLDRALADAAPAATIVPSLDDHRRRRFGRPSLPASAAASVIVLAFAAIVVAAIMHGGGSTSSGGASEASGTFGASGSTVQPAQPHNYTRTSTGLTYTPSKLLADVPGLVAGLPGEAPRAAPAEPNTAVSPSSAPSTFTLENHAVPVAMRPLFDSRAKLLACAAYLTGIPHAVPLTVDFGRWTNGAYKGAPSAVLVMRDSNPDVVDVYVTGPTCSGTGAIRTYIKVPVK
jgi:hypothetical protein